MGIHRVRPLLGGYFGWRDLGLPLDDFNFDAREPAGASPNA
jgi:3-mercaptopyruvate sulfurtransferase SseA